VGIFLIETVVHLEMDSFMFRRANLPLSMPKRLTSLSSSSSSSEEKTSVFVRLNRNPQQSVVKSSSTPVAMS